MKLVFQPQFFRDMLVAGMYVSNEKNWLFRAYKGLYYGYTTQFCGDYYKPL